MQNCGGCWKCLRTQISLQLLGQLDNYQEVFDTKKFKLNILMAYSKVVVGCIMGASADRELILKLIKKSPLKMICGIAFSPIYCMINLDYIIKEIMKSNRVFKRLATRIQKRGG